ncbi:MAG: FumA C-terminus/TtdB family hydratase beta subunit [Desulfovibrionaceae bacterium]|nr:FumA C-terminus/TtdB family hydratase beta subunit [Desulfovibrionaceae bacterium]
MSNQPRHITAPFDRETARSLRAGESVRITGTLLAARDAAHKAMCECLDRGEPLPVDLEGQVVYYVGPTPAKPGMAIGACGPTTAGRMDAYAPRLMAQGLLGMIGKGYRAPAVVEAMREHGVPYLVALGGAGALLCKCVTSYTVLAWPELGPEALARLEVKDFPAIVAIDCEGRNYYETAQAAFREED